jgi:hypothetical protein
VGLSRALRSCLRLENSSPVCIFVGLFSLCFCRPVTVLVLSLDSVAEASLHSVLAPRIPACRPSAFADLFSRSRLFLSSRSPRQERMEAMIFIFPLLCLLVTRPQFFCSSHSHKEWQDSLHMQHEIKFLFGV